MNNDLEQRVKKILSDKSDYPVEEINLDSALIDDLGMDSFSAIEIMFAIDNEFSVKITQDEISDFNNVGDVVDKIRALIKD